MNAEEIRAEAIERVARSQYERWRAQMEKLTLHTSLEPHYPSWDEHCDEGNWGRDSFRRVATHDVDALGDLLPTGVEEWGWLRKTHSTPWPNTRQHTRYVTGWTEVPR